MFGSAGKVYANSASSKQRTSIVNTVTHTLHDSQLSETPLINKGVGIIHEKEQFRLELL